MEGSLTGDVTLRGGRSAPEGEATLEAGPGRYLGRAFASARVKARWSPSTTRDPGRPGVLGGGDVRFKGRVTDDGIYDGTAEIAVVELPRSGDESGHSAVPLFGRVFGEVTLQGPLSRPRLLGRLRSPHLFVGDEGLGALDAHFEGHGDGEVSVKATCRSARVDLGLEGHVGAAPPYMAELVLTARDTSLDPFVRVAYPPFPVDLGLRTTGELRVRGPLGEPRELNADLTLERFDVLAPDYPGRAKMPVRARFEKGVLTVEDFDIAAEGTDVSLRGRADLLGRGQIDLQAQGATDLRGLVAVSSRLRGFGGARLDVAVTGTRAEPRVPGVATAGGRGAAGARLPPRPRRPHGNRAVHRERRDSRRGQGHARGRPPRSRRPGRLRGGRLWPRSTSGRVARAWPCAGPRDCAAWSTPTSASSATRAAAS